MTIFTSSSIFWVIIHCDCLLTSCSFLYRSSFYITIPSKKATTAKQASLADFVVSNALKYSIISNNASEISRDIYESSSYFLQLFLETMFYLATEQRAGAYTVIPCQHSKLLDWQFHIRRWIYLWNSCNVIIFIIILLVLWILERRLRDSLSLITGDPVGIEEITSAVSSAVAIESSSIKLLSEDCCSNVFVVCVGYLLNNSSHLHAEVHSNMCAVILA